MVNLVIWNEFVHEQEDEHVKSIYPKGIHGCIKDFLSDDKGDTAIGSGLKFPLVISTSIKAYALKLISNSKDIILKKFKFSSFQHFFSIKVQL